MKDLLKCAAQRAKQGDPLLFGKDVNTAKFVDGKKVSFNGNIANPVALKKAYSKDGATLQVLQGSNIC